MQQSGNELPLSVAPGRGNHTTEREEEKKAVIEAEKHNEADRLGREREGEILILMNHHFHVSADALRIPTSVPPNPASL